VPGSPWNFRFPMPGAPGRPPRSPTGRPTPTRCRRMPASARKPCMPPPAPLWRPGSRSAA